MHTLLAVKYGTCYVLLQGFSLRALKHLVLDEADKLLDMDFEQEIDQILKVGSLRSLLGLQAGSALGPGVGFLHQLAAQASKKEARTQGGGWARSQL